MRKANRARYHCREGVVQGGLDRDPVAVDHDDPGNVLDVGDPLEDVLQIGVDVDVHSLSGASRTTSTSSSPGRTASGSRTRCLLDLVGHGDVGRWRWTMTRR